MLLEEDEGRKMGRKELIMRKKGELSLMYSSMRMRGEECWCTSYKCVIV